MNAGLTQNYFEIFGMPEHFDIDTRLLAEHYRELQKSVHPDRFASAGDRDRRLAVQQAAHINEAYHVLKSPLRRARYLLQLKGVDFDDEKETTMDPAFLMEQMELREALAEVKGADEPFTALSNIMADIDVRTASLLSEFEDLVQQADLASAKSIVQKLQFMDKLKTESEGLEAELADAI